MDNNDKFQTMTVAAKQLSDMIQKRLANRVEALNSLSIPGLESVPDEVKKMREDEASKIRAVMQEQKDLIEIIKMLFPGA